MAKRSLALGLGVVLALIAALYGTGAALADPDVGSSQFDLAVVRSWISAGQIGSFHTPSTHLAKPGFLLFLYALLPQGGVSAAELRRILALNATLLFLGIVAVTLALWRKDGAPRAVAFALITLVLLPFRDSADYVASDPLAVAFCFAVVAALLLWPASTAAAGAMGVSLALFALVRPNVTAMLLLLATILFAHGAESRIRTVPALLLGVLTGCLALAAAARVSGWPLNPLSMSGSQTLLYATADYFWPPDLGVWPTGASQEETARLQTQKAKDRWRARFASAGSDRTRAMIWQLSHSILSTEQLPGTWSFSPYEASSKLVRQWWWLLMVAAIGLAAASAVGGKRPWSLVPVTLLALTVIQGLVFSAETRFTLPILPIVIVGLLRTLPAVRFSARTAMAALLAGVFPIVALLKVPETASSDYAVARPGDVIRQRISPREFQPGETGSVHTRLLAFPIGARVAYDVLADQTLVYRREQSDASAHPAFVTFTIRGEALQRARRSGLDLQINVVAAEPGAFVAFPVVPPPLAPRCTVNASSVLRSGFGGFTRGAIPLWTHSGADSPSSP